ncbi:MAG TPA: GrpB family protein [Gaiellaceae bacterium]|nr:GrpB family protein [Gaiellaceae bacterium]
MPASVSWIAFTPVKGLALHLADEIEVGESGLHGDRRFFLVDENDRLVNDKGHGALQTVRATYDESRRALRFDLPDGRAVEGAVETGDEIVTTFHGTPKRARLAPGPWDEALSGVAGIPVRLVEPERPAPDRGRSGAATLLGEGSLAAMARVLGVEEIDGRRFRMNFGVSGLEPHAEDAWIGRRMRIGEAVVVPAGNVGRCAVTTQDPRTGIRDLDTLGALADYRGEVETTEPLPFGVHALVAAPGRVRVGDLVAPDGDALTAPIQLVEYDEAWPVLYEQEEKRIRSALGDRVLKIAHVGSTSVPGLAAKPRIDVLLVVADSRDENGYVPALEAAGYVLRVRERDWHEHRLFKGPGVDVNLHVFSAGCTEIDRMLRFRDHLREDPEDRALYERTKRDLARRPWTHMQEYADAKTPVVEEILERAGEPRDARVGA